MSGPALRPRVLSLPTIGLLPRLAPVLLFGAAAAVVLVTLTGPARVVAVPLLATALVLSARAARSLFRVRRAVTAAPEPATPEALLVHASASVGHAAHIAAASPPSPTERILLLESASRLQQRLQALRKVLEPAPPAAPHAETLMDLCRQVRDEVVRERNMGDAAIRFFGVDDGAGHVPGLRVMLYGLIRMAAAAADEDEPFVTVAFSQSAGHVDIDVTHNGPPPVVEGTGEQEAAASDLEEARRVASSLGGTIAWTGVPRGTALALRLPYGLVVPRLMPTRRIPGAG